MVARFATVARRRRVAGPLMRCSGLSLACLLLAGCGGDDAWHAETQPVQGKITINGQPPAGAVVTLYPTGAEFDVRESKPWGVVGPDGIYQLRTYEKGDGAPRGEYDVTIVWRENPSIPGSPDMLSGAYDEPTESQWSVTIEEDQTELPPIEVTGAKVAENPRRQMQRPSPFEEPEVQ
ncbi:hypothetical protein [Candidatus Laterigemmans baculatus]|uniref:hypothetical protein n=1 Tax=Candidatus Laterigemmans baculatus TaxID=2770505 RepID=UPI0013D8E7F4|nr:hypothetical protein [Candidatus Laterigemmans baculatus]